jgi:integrase
MSEEEKQSEKKQRKQRPHAHHGEGSVFKVNDPKRKKPYVAQVTLEGGKKKATYHRTEKEANVALRKMLYALEHGQLVTARQQTVKAYLEQWLEAKRLQLKDGSYEHYRKYVAHYFVPSFGDITLQKLTEAHIQTCYRKLLDGGIQPRTIRTIHSTLNSALNAAVRSHKLTINPCKFVTLPRVPKRELSCLSIEQARHLVEVTREHKFGCLFTLALATGMRIGELRALHWGDIDEKRAMVRVSRSLSFTDPDGVGHATYREEEPKTESSRRTIPLPAFAIEALQRHRVRQKEERLRTPGWQDQGLVFTNTVGGHLNGTLVRRTFADVLAEAGLPHIRFHDLRHSMATIWLAMGVNPKVVQERLGHSDIKTTLNVYGHVLPGMQEDATHRYGEQFDGTR